MLNRKNINKVLDHPDIQTIVSKLVAGESAKEVHDWLASKYVTSSETRFVLSTEYLDTFYEQHLDFYLKVREDALKTKSAVDPEKALERVVKGSKAYKKGLEDFVNTEIDIKSRVKQVLYHLEIRIEQVFDKIQEDPDSFKDDHTLIKYLTLLMDYLDRGNKILNDAPDQVIQHNVNLRVADQQTSLIIDTVKDILNELDYEKSLLFIELYNEKLAALSAPEAQKPASQEVRLAEAKILSEKASTIG